MEIGTTNWRTAIWALSVGVVLADSSVVTLALPDILREYDTSVFGVSWVLTAYNLVLAALIIPASHLARRLPFRTWGVGIGVFGLASLGCALAPDVGSLIVGRCVQAAGGAAILAGAIEMIARARGGHRSGALLWGTAGTIGLVLGPALGGTLTQLLSWESIFFLQVPMLGLLVAVPALLPAPERGPEGPDRDRRPEIALALLSAGLTAALFLLVVLLTEGWGLSPLAAAAVVSVMPAAALLAGRISLAGPDSGHLAIAGSIAIVGGLAGLGVLPGATVDLVIAPQLLIGVGLALTLPVLTAAALGDHDPRGARGAETLAARHAGIVVGILLLTPLLSSQLEAQADAGRDAGTALLLDSPIPAQAKLEVAVAVDQQITSADQLPDLAPAFDGIDVDEADRSALNALEEGINDQLERAATHAFSLPFLGAALFAALSLLAMWHLRRSDP